jgi:predicted HTH transcriptional regulator
MPDADPELVAFITHGREERNIEYKGTGSGDGMDWTQARVKSRLVRKTMAMANIGGGVIVLGVDEVGGRCEPTGLPPATTAAYKQDDVQEYVNQRADPYVRLTLSHVEWQTKRFVVIQVRGFDELSVVCTRNGEHIREGAVYTRPFTKHESVEVQSQSEMRELLDRAIAVGVTNRLRPVFEALRQSGTLGPAMPSAGELFRRQRGDL